MYISALRLMLFYITYVYCRVYVLCLLYVYFNVVFMYVVCYVICVYLYFCNRQRAQALAATSLHFRRHRPRAFSTQLGVKTVSKDSSLKLSCRPWGFELLHRVASSGAGGDVAKTLSDLRDVEAPPTQILLLLLLLLIIIIRRRRIIIIIIVIMITIIMMIV